MASKIKGAGRVFAKSFCNQNESYIWSSWKHQHLSNKNSFGAEAHSLHFLTSNARGYENARERVLLPMKWKTKKKDMTSLYPLLLLIAQNSIMLDPAANKIFFLVPTNVLELSQKKYERRRWIHLICSLFFFSAKSSAQSDLQSSDQLQRDCSLATTHHSQWNRRGISDILHAW